MARNRRQTDHHAERIRLAIRDYDDRIYPLAGRVCGPLSAKRLLARSAANPSDYPSCGKRRSRDYRRRQKLQ
ncbi:hypothetical protein CWM92_28805, partial [Klebsiella michiganensis]